MTFAPNANDRLWKDPEQNGKFNLPSLLRYLILILVILCLILGAWYLFSPHRPRLNEAALPLIQADGTPYKVKAQDQGIPAIKHQDKLVYGRIRNDQNTPTVEHILPDPEPPLAHTKDENSTVKMVDQYIPEEIQLEASKIAAPQMTSIDDLLEDLPEEKSKTTEDIKKQSEPEDKVTRKQVLIQLGSLKSYELAQAEWARLSTKHKELLGNLEPIIQKVDLGVDKGIYYRLRVSQDTIEHGKKICAEMVDCRVIH